MTRNILFVLMCMLSLNTPAQNKAERIKQIREMYAQAQAQVANNGKDGNAAKDMTISTHELVSQEHDVHNETELSFFFHEKREIDVSDGSFTAHEQPYFIIEKNTQHFHYTYREFLFDANGKLAFAYARWELDNGSIVEHRYYFDTKGQCIETKMNPDTPDYGNGQESLKMANRYLAIFKSIMEVEEKDPAQSNATPTRSGSDQIKHIRTQYATAKDKVAEKLYTFYPYTISITIHNQEEGDCPPVTDEYNFYGEKSNNDASSATECYFLSIHRSLSGFDHYGEFLLDSQTHQLIFNYSRGAEEGEVREWRYYFDEAGRCIETKSNAEEVDNGISAQRAIGSYLKTFKLLTNE